MLDLYFTFPCYITFSHAVKQLDVNLEGTGAYPANPPPVQPAYSNSPPGDNTYYPTKQPPIEQPPPLVQPSGAGNWAVAIIIYMHVHCWHVHIH